MADPSQVRHIGTCKWFDRKKGYGFIACEGQADIFVHQTEIQVKGFRALYPDQQVEFAIQEAGPNNRICATHVTGVSGEEIEPRSSRGRGRGSRSRGRGNKKSPLKNTAFVFIKPHAVTDATKKLVESTFESKDISILSSGTLTAEEIDEKKLIDKHYYAIASKATILKPHQLAVPKDKFKEAFGLDWQKALDDKVVFNAMDGAKQLGVNADKLDSLWAECKKKKKLVKFGGGFYCGLVEHGGKSLYIFNGFFMSMRSKFTTPGTSIFYYVVEWAPSRLAWADFRGKVLGPTDPAEAPADSLRGLINAQWKDLGLKAAPNTGDNGVHASASPFESLVERMNWLGIDTGDDAFGSSLMAAGVSEATISDWSVDPRVEVPPDMTNESLFDTVEDLDSAACLAKCTLIATGK